MDIEWIPNYSECMSLLDKTALKDNVQAHARAVCAQAMPVVQLVKNANSTNSVNSELVMAGALLHDIGRSRTHGIEHAVVGAAILSELGVSSKVQLIALRHIGGGISMEEAEELGLPPEDYFPVSIEEKIVAACDNLIRGSKKASLKLLRYRLAAMGLKQAADRCLELHKKISGLCGVDLDEIPLDYSLLSEQ